MATHNSGRRADNMCSYLPFILDVGVLQVDVARWKDPLNEVKEKHVSNDALKQYAAFVGKGRRAEGNESRQGDKRKYRWDLGDQKNKK